MSYTTAVTNHTVSSYFNVADWERVYENAKLTSSLAEILLDSLIAFDVVVAQSTTTDPTTILTSLNTLLANIERLRLAVAGESIPGTSTEIKDDWVAGPGKDSPDYTDVNLWESTIDAIWEYFNGPDLEVCPTLSADLTIATGTQYVVVDCIKPGNFAILPQGTGTLYII